MSKIMNVYIVNTGSITRLIPNAPDCFPLLTKKVMNNLTLREIGSKDVNLKP